MKEVDYKKLYECQASITRLAQQEMVVVSKSRNIYKEKCEMQKEIISVLQEALGRCFECGQPIDKGFRCGDC